MNYKTLSLLSFVLIGCSNESPTEQPLSPELAAARDRALALCSGCHGPTGIGTAEITPNLAGQNKAYLIKQLKDFRSGQRTNHPPMTYIARMLTEDEILTISEWFSTQENSKKAPK